MVASEAMLRFRLGLREITRDRVSGNEDGEARRRTGTFPGQFREHTVGPVKSAAGKPPTRISMFDHLFTRVAGRIAAFTGQPIAFVAATISILVWLLSGPIFGYSDTWQLVVNTATTVITFLMVFLIQNSQNRDAAAMQAKLDEVIRSLAEARNQFIGIEHRTDKEIELIRADLERECNEDSIVHSAAASVARLGDRY
jgi:low affinity Fe/Cu permease